MLCPLPVLQADVSADPGRTGVIGRYIGNVSNVVLLAPKVIKRNRQRRLKGCNRIDRSGRRRHVEQSQRIFGKVRIAPCPEPFPFVDRTLNTVTAEGPAFPPVETLSQFLALTENPSTGQSAETLGYDRSIDGDLLFATGLE